jgi:hypothetical protein
MIRYRGALFLTEGLAASARTTSNQEIHLPDAEKPGSLIYLTYFNAGSRVYNIKDPIQTSVLGRCAFPIVLTWNHFLPDDCMAAVNAPPVVGDSCCLHDTTYQFF